MILNIFNDVPLKSMNLIVGILVALNELRTPPEEGNSVRPVTSDENWALHVNIAKYQVELENARSLLNSKTNAFHPIDWNQKGSLLGPE